MRCCLTNHRYDVLPNDIPKLRKERRNNRPLLKYEDVFVDKLSLSEVAAEVENVRLDSEDCQHQPFVARAPDPSICVGNTLDTSHLLKSLKKFCNTFRILVICPDISSRGVSFDKSLSNILLCTNL